MSDHGRIERQSAAMHRVIAARIRGGDELPLARARENPERWKQQFGGVLPTAYFDWQVVLSRDLAGVLHVLESDDQDSVRRRSSSSFTEILTPQERWSILRDAGNRPRESRGLPMKSCTCQ